MSWGTSGEQVCGNARQNGQVERKSVLKVSPGPPRCFGQRVRGNFERESASSTPDERAEPRGIRTVISESSNGCCRGNAEDGMAIDNFHHYDEDEDGDEDEDEN